MFPSHNHVTDNAAALSRNRVSLETKDILEQSFQEGLSPAVSLRKIKEKHSSQPSLLANRSLTPDYKYVNQYVYISYG